MNKYNALILISLLLFSCTKPLVEKGKASYYADKYDGKKTSNGEIYRIGKMTAAHKTLPFGTKATVTNLKNGKKVKVRINDRGPYTAGRVIDVSKKAARKLDMVNDGVANVELRYRK